MKIPHRKYTVSSVFFVVTAALVGFGLFVFGNLNDTHAVSEKGRLITVYDRGSELVFLSESDSVEEALVDAGFELDTRDAVEPARDEALVATDYKINIYRARPVTVIDGAMRQKVMTPYQTPEHIAADAGVKLYPEDVVDLGQSDDFLSDGAGLQLTIDRATEFTFDLYGKKTDVRTQASTVGDMLAEKEIELAENDRVSPSLSTTVKSGMDVRVWREGVQTITVDEAVDFEVEKIQDADRPVGYRNIQTPGVKGERTVTYEVKIINGKEESRKEIASITTKESVKQVEVVGVKAGNGLTKSKGVNVYVDSNGVAHRETYYDLPMNIVMRNCGGDGTYNVREDGAKIDRDGYVIVAAHLGNYPRCSVVETSLGLGKVYDTGGFASVHPHGFDLATDWTGADGI